MPIIQNKKEAANAIYGSLTQIGIQDVGVSDDAVILKLIDGDCIRITGSTWRDHDEAELEPCLEIEVLKVVDPKYKWASG